MQKYESVVVFDGSLPAEAIAKEQLKLEELIKENGSLEKIDIWGKKELAYTIDKKKTGFYIFFQYEFSGDANELISGSVRYNEKVLRSMTVLHTGEPFIAKKTVDAAPEKDDE